MRERWVHWLAPCLMLHLLALPAAGQTVGAVNGAPAQVDSVQRALDEMRARLDRQTALIEQQARRIEAQESELDMMRKRLDAVSGLPAVQAPTATPTAPSMTQTLEARVQAVEQTVKRLPELPDKIVVAGEFPGSIKVPGTDTAFRIGGQLRSTLVHTLGPLGTDDRCIASSIPVGGESAGESARTTYTAAPSRVNLDLRSVAPFGVLRTFVEGDFAGAGNTARLRHAFIHTNRWLFGQTWSTFSDPEVEPIDIDFEGENALSRFRQAQARYTRPFGEGLDIAVAVENPAPDLTGAEGVNLTPDVVVRLRWEPRGGPENLLRTPAHVQGAVLIRTLRGDLVDQPEVTLSTRGFGGTVSGVLVPRWKSDDRFKFAAYGGWGIGRYITDLGAEGGQDAVYDPATNALRALPVSSAYIGYEHPWRPSFTSSVTYGVVTVHNLLIQPGGALHRTQRATVNVTWNPITRADVVLEFLTGERVNKDGQRGLSSQIQAGWKVRF